jgi:hypothetical protein
MENLKELSACNLRQVKGGFVPIVWGAAVILKSSTVKSLFLAGMAAGGTGAAAALTD